MEEAAMKPCTTCPALGPFPNGRRQCNACYRAAERVAYTAVAIESTVLSSAEISRLIKINLDAQQAVLDDILPDKAVRREPLQREQWRLFAQRDAARKAERGQAPRERVGVRRQGR